MTATLRRAAGLLGMLSAVGTLVALKSAGGGGSHAVVLAAPAPAARPVTGQPKPAKAFTGTVTGAVTDTPFGPVQVELSLSAGRIVSVRALQLPNNASYSQQVASYAVPILQQEVLTAQSARIDVVSGATYDSYGYAQSVQSALDKAHA